MRAVLSAACKILLAADHAGGLRRQALPTRCSADTVRGCASGRRKARHDYEYERNGVANLFMVFAPLEGWRLVKVTDRRLLALISLTLTCTG
jgi:hypothetical protein